MGARKPWKFQSRRQTKSDMGLKHDSVYYMDAGRLVESQWPCQAVTMVAEMREVEMLGLQTYYSEGRANRIC